MLDAVHDRIVIVNQAGKVVYANAPARSDFDGAVSGLLVQRELRHAVERVTQHLDSGPIRLTLVDAAGDEHALSVVPAPNGSDASVIVHADTGHTDMARAEGRTVAELMRQHLHAPLDAFIADLRQIAAASPQGAPAPAVDHARALQARLEKVIDMIAVFGADALAGDERVLPKALVESAVQDGLSDALRNRVSVVLTGFDVTLPPIYGSERWLRRAVREIVENAARHGLASAGGPATVEVKAIQAGEFLTLNFRNRGAFRGAAGADGTFIPFTAAAGKTTAGATRIGLPLAQRIVELHGGSLKLRDDDDSTEVSVQLPTGAPRQLAPQLDASQAQRYAEDLSKLLARRRAGDDRTH